MWGIERPKSSQLRYADIYVGRIKVKLADSDCHDLIKTVRGVGYTVEAGPAVGEQATANGRPPGPPLHADEDATEPDLGLDFDAGASAFFVRVEGGDHLPSELPIHPLPQADEAHPAARIGRSGACDIVIDDRRVSRWHATVPGRRRPLLPARRREFGPHLHQPPRRWPAAHPPAHPRPLQRPAAAGRGAF